MTVADADVKTSRHIVGVVRRTTLWSTFALIVAVVWAIASWIGFGRPHTSDSRETWLRLGVGGALLLVPTLGWVIEWLRPHPVVRRARELREEAKAPPDFEGAAAGGFTVVCEGELLVTMPTASPIETHPCAAYFAHRLVEGSVQALFGSGLLVLRTASHGDLELGEGSWWLESSFDPTIENGEALLQAGARVLVEGIPKATAGGVGYRDEARKFSLEPNPKVTHGPRTRIVPASGEYSSTEIRTRRPADAVTVGLAVAAVALTTAPYLIPAKTTPTAASSSAKPCASGEVLIEGACAARCDASAACSDGKVCDAEEWTCVKHVAGSKKEGEDCARSECGAGLRCRADIAGGTMKRACRRACTSDAQCAADEWCLPCSMSTLPEAQRGDCVKRSKLAGAFESVCRMTHGLLPSAAPASPSPSASP
ncbi:MAG: hypothetical protein U0271_25945 [Polyangiaceae bacterium]